MPHLTIEHSANILETDFAEALLARCHDILSTSLPSNIENFKSRVVRHEIFRVGAGSGAFVHVTLHILPGRSDAVRQTVYTALADLMREAFARSLKERGAQITLNIVDLASDYVKITA